MNKLSLPCSCGEKNCQHHLDVAKDIEIPGNAALFFKSSDIKDPWLGFISLSKEDIIRLIAFLKRL